MCHGVLKCFQSRSLVIGVAQMNAGRTVSDATDRICVFLEEASQRGASICAFPETAITVGVSNDRLQCWHEHALWHALYYDVLVFGVVLFHFTKLILMELVNKTSWILYLYFIHTRNVHIKYPHVHIHNHSVRTLHFRASTCVNTKSYDPDVIDLTTAEELNEAENMIKSACAKFEIAAVVGGPHIAERGQTFNSALLVSETGHTVGRQHKMQLVGDDANWCSPGQSLNVFRLGGAPVSVIICHDKRYPELVLYRLPLEKKKTLLAEFLRN